MLSRCIRYLASLSPNGMLLALHPEIAAPWKLSPALLPTTAVLVDEPVSSVVNGNYSTVAYYAGLQLSADAVTGSTTLT